MGVQYSKVIETFDLVLIPYLNTGLGEEQEIQNGINILIYLMAYIKENYDVLIHLFSTKYKTYSLEDMCYTLYSFFGFNIELYMDEVLEYSFFNVYEHFHKISRHISFDIVGVNPDYFTGELMCIMGYKGWVRVSNFDTNTMGDEIYICNIKKFKDSLMDTNECNLTSSCKK